MKNPPKTIIDSDDIILLIKSLQANIIKNTKSSGIKESYYEYHIFFSELLSKHNSFICNLINHSKTNLYRTIQIQKRSGGRREISIPRDSLKELQRELNSNFLQRVYLPPDEVHGFVKLKSIVTNAKEHISKSILINFDIKDFFNSIKKKRVHDIFLGYPFFLNKLEKGEFLAYILTEICTLGNCIPQGAPTSPTLANISCKRLDEQLLEYSNKNGMKYTRYSDDITFSTSKKDLPKNLYNDIEKILAYNEFQLNTKKFRARLKTRHQEVTGIIVNEKLNVRRSYIKNVRAILHSWEKDGIENVAEKYWDKYYKSRFVKRYANYLNNCLVDLFYDPELVRLNSEKIISCYTNSVRGKIEFVGMVRGKQDLLYNSMLKKYATLLDRYNSQKF